VTILILFKYYVYEDKI